MRKTTSILVGAVTALAFAAIAATTALAADPPQVTKEAREAGAIWNDGDAKKKCPRVCTPPSEWRGQWWTTVRGKMSVCECVTAAAEPEPTAAPEAEAAPSPPPAGPMGRRRPPVSHDVDGDGKADLVLQYDHQGTRRWQARRSNGEAFDYNKDWTDTRTPDVTAVGVADVNGDGKADLVLQYDHQGKRRWQARLSTGERFDTSGDWTETSTPNVTAVGLADVDGDGRADLVLQYDHQGKRRWQARLSTGTAFAFNGDWTETSTPNVDAVGLADVNGDGKADLVLVYDHQGKRRWQARRSNGEAFEFNGDWTETSTPNVEVVGLADMDGDRKADLVLVYDHKGKRRWQARRSTGEAFGYNKDWTETSTPNVVAFDLLDANGDGKTDLAVQYDHEGKRRWQVRRSTGEAFDYNKDWTETGTPNVVTVGSAWQTPIPKRHRH
ncbi:MAG: FG-GAP-like repeat-containing protein [Myxococcota bacterium]